MINHQHFFSTFAKESKVMNTKEDLQHLVEIKNVIQRYTEGTFEGNAEKLNQVFHANAVMNGFLMGKLMLSTPKPFIEDMEKLQLKTQGLAYQSNITGIDIDGKVASIVLTESGFPGNVSFTNYFHLIYDDDQWKIISKTFCSKN